jgi:tetratricopeptide (TPR) repeat protein
MRDEEIGRAVGSAIGWALSAGAGGVGTVARSMRERKAQRLMDEFESATAAADGGRMLRAADEMVRRWPSEDYGYELRARALVVLERSAEAVAALNRAVQLGMDPYEANVGRAAAYEVGGQTGKAIQEYTALVNHPNSAEARAVGLLGRAHCLLELDDLDQALNDVNQAIATQPDEEAYFARAVIHSLCGDDEQCLADMGRAIRLAPDNLDLREARADKLESLDRVEEATADRVMVAAARGADGGEAEASDPAAPSTPAQPPHEPPAVATPPSTSNDPGTARAATEHTGPPPGAVRYWTNPTTRNTAFVLVGCALVLVIASIAAVEGADIKSASTSNANASSANAKSSGQTLPISDAELTSFVSNYYALLPNDTASAWPMLSESVQAAGGGRTKYEEFYGGLSSLRVVRGPTVIGDNTVRVELEFRTASGRSSVEQFEVQVVQRGGSLLINSARREAPAQSAPYAVAYLSDGRRQAFRSVEGAAWIQTRWETAVGGPWSTWVDAEYPPTAAGVNALKAGTQANITYYYVFTNGGGNWVRKKISTDPNSTWTPYLPL